MSHGLILLFDSMSCGKPYCIKACVNQAFLIPVNGTAVIRRSNCTQIGVEVFDCSVNELLQRAEELFALISKPSDFSTESEEKEL
jgi:Fe-S-cluster-containing dehydrogenase component